MFLLHIKENLPVLNNLFAQYWALLVIGSYLLNDIDGNLLRVSATILLTPATCWILGLNYFRMILQSITLWDSLRVAT